MPTLLKAITRTETEIQAGKELSPDEIAHNLEVLRRAVEILYEQRSSLAQDGGEGGTDELDEGCAALKLLQRAFPYVPPRPRMFLPNGLTLRLVTAKCDAVPDSFFVIVSHDEHEYQLTSTTPGNVGAYNCDDLHAAIKRGEIDYTDHRLALQMVEPTLLQELSPNS